MEAVGGGPGRFRLTPQRFAFAFAAFVALGYILYTGHVWEDFLITFRHSKNLAEGRGLVFQPGERVHGFTSPLGVLLPAVFHFLLGNPESFQPALWCFRVLGIAAFAGGIAFFVNTLVRAGAGRWAFAAAAILALESKGVVYSTNGQETGLMIFFLGWSVDLLSRPGPYRWKLLALAWAGLQWTRPDGFVVGASWAIARLIFTNNPDRRELFVAYWKALGLSLLLYAPWLVGTTLYYGTPVPHTVIAKSVSLQAIGSSVEDVMNYVTARMRWLIEPAGFFFGGWPIWSFRFGLTLALAGAASWAIPGGGALSQFARRASFASLLLLAYFCKITIYAWYVPPAAVLLLAALAAAAIDGPIRTAILMTCAYVAAVLVEEARLRIGHSSQNLLLIVGAILVLLSWRDKRWMATASLLVGGAGFLATTLVLSTHQMRMQQEIIENGCRTPVGLWLRDHVADGETVYLECLGYIGYFSERHVLDYPGLATPQVANIHRNRAWEKETTPTERMALMIPDLKPDWLVLRDAELQAAQRLNAIDGYTLRRRFDVGPVIEERCPEMVGVGYLWVDARFNILQRGGATTAPDRRDAPPGGPDS
jgi:hypothetical protein